MLAAPSLAPGRVIGVTSIDIDCQFASNNLCPSRREEMPAFPLQGRSLRKGVRFSVHTTSRGRVPWRRCRLSCDEVEKLPRGENVMTGRVVRVESMKLRLAQKRPESAFVRVSHCFSAL